MVARLAAMLFLQSLPLGCWGVTIGTFIAANTGDAGSGAFSSGFIGYSTAAGAIGGLVSPVLVGALSDRRFSAEKLLFVLHGCCALASLALLWSQTQIGLFVALLAFFHCYVPATALANKIGLRHLSDPEREFPIIRVFGALGWISAGLLVGLFWPLVSGASIEATRTPFAIGAVAELIVAVYALTLPATPPVRDPSSEGVGWSTRSVIAVLRSNRELAIFLVIALIACVPSMAYNNFANPYLNETGYRNAAALMTLGQASEIATLILMPWLVTRLGLLPVFTVGVASWIARYVALAADASWGAPALTFAAILLHGPCFAFVYVAAPIHVDRLVPASRSGLAQGLYAVVALGAGHLAGAWFAGFCQHSFLTPPGIVPPPYDWSRFWLAPAAVSAVAAITCLTASTLSRSSRQAE